MEIVSVHAVIAFGAANHWLDRGAAVEVTRDRICHATENGGRDRDILQMKIPETASNPRRINGSRIIHGRLVGIW